MHYLKYSQKLPLTQKESWDFFSSPANLKKITPEHLEFTITSPLETGKMYEGQIITYTIRPLWNIPIQWTTEITHVNEPHYFIDDQRAGPYQLWHHEHRFEPIPNGVEMTDIIYYQLPFGPLGSLLNYLKVRKDVEAIFSYRKTKLEQLFGPY